VTGIIIAGGKSTRMGKDKSLLNQNVSRIQTELGKVGCESVYIMCGSKERIALFDGNCVPDSKSNLAQSLLDLIKDIEGEIQLVPCDAYLVDAEFLQNINGVPVDDNGERQPLLARITDKALLVNSDKITEVFENIQSCGGGLKARNFNTPEEFMEIESLLKQLDL